MGDGLRNDRYSATMRMMVISECVFVSATKKRKRIKKSKEKQTENHLISFIVHMDVGLILASSIGPVDPTSINVIYGFISSKEP